MKKKRLFGKIAASVLCLSFAFGFAGCDLFITDSEADMKQVVGEVDISSKAGLEEEQKSIVRNLNGTILKRDLIAYFLNVGSTYIQNYGMSYEDAFKALMDNLVNRKIIAQCAVEYYLKGGNGDASFTVAGHDAYVKSEKEKADETLKKHYDAHPEILTLKYFLTDGGSETEDYDKAVYRLKRSVNNSLDSSEPNYIKKYKDDDSSSSSGETRTLPNNVNTEQDDYYSLDYDIYTGRNAADSCGTYERLDGSTQTSRLSAYNAFLASLSGNGLIRKDENTSDFSNTDYYYVELASQLEQALITKYGDDLTKKSNGELADAYVQAKYEELSAAQKNSYDASQSTFESKLDSLSDTSFVMYSPKENFGFVYNILLPFSSSQSDLLDMYNASEALNDSQKNQKRAEILENVQAKDLRSDWFSTVKDKNYSYEAAGDYFDKAEGQTQYLFFENNMTKNERYKDLGQYLGKYPYHGTATKDAKGNWSFKPAKMNIDQFMDEMEAYIRYAVKDYSDVSVSGSPYDKYVTDGKYTLDADGKFDYSEFIYYEGKVTGLDASRKDYFVKDTAAYQAVSAVNELMFAYSTDTGCLNKYKGYLVSPYKTSYVAEFEYAAQYAIDQGVGTYVVCPSTYGWHIIYVSFVYPKGEVYEGGYKPEEKEIEGTFSYLFYEALKSDSSSSSSYVSMVQSSQLEEYKDCATKYEKNYKNLLKLG